MFSAEKSEREKVTERLKYFSAVQLILGIGLFVCAIVAVLKQDDKAFFSYPIGGFSCGITGAVAGIVGIYTSFKASSIDGDDVPNLRKQLKCTALVQMILGYVLCLLAISGIMMAVPTLVNHDTDHQIHVILAGCIIGGIVLLLVATLPSFCITSNCCMCDDYEHAMNQTYPATVGTMHYNQGQTTYGPLNNYSAGGFNTGSHSFGMGQQQPFHGFQQNTIPTVQHTAFPY